MGLFFNISIKAQYKIHDFSMRYDNNIVVFFFSATFSGVFNLQQFMMLIVFVIFCV